MGSVLGLLSVQFELECRLNNTTTYHMRVVDCD